MEEEPEGRDAQGQVQGKDRELLYPLLAHSCPLISSGSPTAMLFKLHPLGFIEALLHRHEPLSHVPFAVGSTSSTWSSGGWDKKSHSLITGLGPLGSSLHSKVLSKTYLTNVTKNTFIVLIT